MRMFRYTGGYYFLYFSPSTIHSTVRETTPGVLWGHTRDWSLRYAISKPSGKGSRSREQAINRISRDCRPLLHILANNIANDAIGREGRRWERGKNFSSSLFDRPTSHFLFVYSSLFFLFSFFIRIFRFEDSKRGCQRATRDSEQRIPARNGIRPLRIELINRISREDIDSSRRGDTFTHLFPSIHISISIFGRLNWPSRKVTDFISRGIFVAANEREMAPLEETIDGPSNVFWTFFALLRNSRTLCERGPIEIWISIV